MYIPKYTYLNNRLFEICLCSKTKTKSKRIINTKFTRVIISLEEREMDMLGKVLMEDFKDISSGRWGMQKDFYFSLYTLI